MNRRKPRVVIPQNFEELHATSRRVNDALDAGGTIITGNPATAPLKLSLEAAIALADQSASTVFVVNEASQTAVSERNTLFEQMRDLLIQIRDFSIANSGGDRSAPGRCGFEVVQSTSSSGNARVVIPDNPDRFIALGLRVASCTADLADPDTVGIAGQLSALSIQARSAHNVGIFRREEWQLLVSERRAIATSLTNVLRKLRDLAFAIAGPRNYESVSSLGFVVQSDATQNASSSSNTSSADAAGDPAPEIQPVTAEQLIDAGFGNIITNDLEFDGDDLVTRIDIRDSGVGSLALEQAWYDLSGAPVPANAFSTVSVTDFVNSFEGIDGIGEFNVGQQVNRYDLFVLDSEIGNDDFDAIEEAFFALF